MTARRFPILFTGLNKLMVVLGLLPRRCYVDVAGADVTVRFAYAFATTISRASIHGVAPYDGLVLGWGVDGWRGRWLVNGSMRNIVAITIDPPVPARVLGIPVKLRTLWVSVVDRDGLIAALTSTACQKTSPPSSAHPDA